MKPIAPPFQNDDAFFCRFFTEVGSYIDTADRRLHEVDFRMEEGEQAFKKCPFHDSRKGYLMNNAALRQITSEWVDIREGVGFFTSLFEVDNEKDLNLARAWRISLSTMFSPLYLFKRKENPFNNGELPTSVSGLFKIMLDVPTTIDLMIMQDAQNEIEISTPKEASKQISAFADSSLILLNGEYACAGSPGLIDDIISIMFENRKYIKAALPRWSSYFPNPKQFQSYNYYMTAQYVIGLMYLISTAVSMEVAFKSLQEIDGLDFSALSTEREDKLSAYERRRRIMLNIVRDCDKGEAVFRKFYNLACDPRKWNLQVEENQGLRNCLDLSLSFLKKTDTATPQRISTLHHDYSEAVGHILAQLQKMIELTIGSKGMFPDNVKFGRLQDRNPGAILLIALQLKGKNLT